jgi:hypothetical protein
MLFNTICVFTRRNTFFTKDCVGLRKILSHYMLFISHPDFLDGAGAYIIELSKIKIGFDFFQILRFGGRGGDFFALRFFFFFCFFS